MKFYVAAKFDYKDEVQKIQNLLRSKGYEISGDWTVHKSTYSSEENQKMSKQYAIEDVEAVKNCDVFILYTTKDIGAGSSTEFGIALQSFLETGKPLIYVLGDYINNMFFYHPAVKMKKTVEEILEDIKNNG